MNQTHKDQIKQRTNKKQSNKIEQGKRLCGHSNPADWEVKVDNEQLTAGSREQGAIHMNFTLSNKTFAIRNHEGQRSTAQPDAPRSIVSYQRFEQEPDEDRPLSNEVDQVVQTEGYKEQRVDEKVVEKDVVEIFVR